MPHGNISCADMGLLKDDKAKKINRKNAKGLFLGKGGPSEKVLFPFFKRARLKSPTYILASD